jgi:transcriptional regulator with XRE-family HTH domain
MMDSHTKLEAARRLRGWSLEVASQKIGVHPRTLRKWETGKSKPHGFRIYKISEVYEMTPSALGIGSERHQWYMPDMPGTGEDEEFLLTRVVEPLMTVEDLDLHLMGLILQRKLEHHNLDYRSFQQRIHQCIKTYDEHLHALQIAHSSDPMRVQALRVVASIPLVAYLDTTTQHCRPAPPTEILTHCASAIAVCWHMDLSQDLHLARSLVSGYIILLGEIFARTEFCRHATAELIAQACLLRTVLAMQLEGTHAGINYYTRALEFSQFTDYTETSAMPPIHAHALYGYGRQPARTLQKMAESLWLLKPISPPPDLPLVRDYLHKLTDLYDLAQSDEPARNTPLPTSNPEVLHYPVHLDYVETALNLWDGLAYHELSEYARTLDSLAPGKANERVCDAPEQIRGEFLHNRALASLRLHDMDHGITTLRAAIPQALSMGNEQELVEAREIYHMMQFLSPGEAPVAGQELKDLFRTHD